MFKCPKCNGKTKVVQTVAADDYGDNVILRRIKCYSCNAMFITKETFERYTEQYIRDEAKRPVKANLGLANFLAQENEAVVKRSQDGMVQLVMKSKPMSREDLIKMYQNVDTSNVGVIPPEV